MEKQVVNVTKALELLGNEAIFKRFLGNYEVKTLDDCLKNQHLSWASMNHVDLERWSHKLKGSSG